MLLVEAGDRRGRGLRGRGRPRARAVVRPARRGATTRCSACSAGGGACRSSTAARSGCPRLIGHSHALDLILTGRGVSRRRGAAHGPRQPADASRATRAGPRSTLAAELAALPQLLPARGPRVELRAVGPRHRRRDAGRATSTACASLAAGECMRGRGALRGRRGRHGTPATPARSSDRGLRQALRRRLDPAVAADRTVADLMSRPVVTARARRNASRRRAAHARPQGRFGRRRRPRRPRHRHPHRTRHDPARGRGLRRVDRQGVGVDDRRTRHGRARRRRDAPRSRASPSTATGTSRSSTADKLVGIVSMRDLMRVAMIQPADAQAHEVPKGLEGVVVADTTVGDVRGLEGFYHYRQYSAVDLAKHAAARRRLVPDVRGPASRRRSPSASAFAADDRGRGARSPPRSPTCCPRSRAPASRSCRSTRCAPRSRSSARRSASAPSLDIDARDAARQRDVDVRGRARR